MNRATLTTQIALAALLLCSACAGNAPTTTTRITPTSQQFSAIQWDRAIASPTAANVNNNNLIQMR